MKTRKAFTLLELLVVLSLLVALSGIVLPICSESLSNANATATRSTLAETRDAMLQYWHDSKLVVLDGVNSVAAESERFEISWLFANPVTNTNTAQFDPNTRKGWNGPYIAVSTTDPEGVGPGLVDAWNQPLSVHYVNPGGSLKDVRIVSAGQNGVVDIPAGMATSSLTTSNIGDDLYVALSLR